MSQEEQTDKANSAFDDATTCDVVPVAQKQSRLSTLFSRSHGVLWGIAALLCVAAISAGVYLTYMAYTANGFLKSVAATGSSQSLFGSDLLTGYTTVPETDDGIAVRSVVVGTGGSTCSFTFKIYNYLLGDKNRVNDKDVNATLTVAANGLSEGAQWSVSGTPAVSENGASLSFPASRATDYTYTVTFPRADLGKASFTIKATVGSNSPGTNLALLAARVAPSEQAQVTAAGVDGAWVKSASETDITAFGAYNYRVTVTGAKTSVTLTWGAKLELDPHFETNHGCTVDATNRTVTFQMEPGSETINFFRAAGVEAPTSWDDEGVKVTCSGSTVESQS